MNSESTQSFQDVFGSASWFLFAAEHEDAIHQRTADDPCAVLLELFRFVAEIENGDVIQYLMNSSGDGFHHLTRCFDEIVLPAGKQWSALVQTQFPNGKVPKSRDQRIDAITAVAGEELAFDPFEEASTLLRKAMPLLEAAIERYMIANKEHFLALREIT